VKIKRKRGCLLLRGSPFKVDHRQRRRKSADGWKYNTNVSNGLPSNQGKRWHQSAVVKLNAYPLFGGGFADPDITGLANEFADFGGVVPSPSVTPSDCALSNLAKH
jgi:hypothetical protein